MQTPTSRLYDALMAYLRQSESAWVDGRHIPTLCWMVIGMIHTHSINLTHWGVHSQTRAVYAQSRQRRFRRWLDNPRIDVMGLYQLMIRAALADWGDHRLYLSLDTRMVWNKFCIVWLTVNYRGRAVPLAWQVVKQASSTVRLRVIQTVLRQAQKVIPQGAVVVLLADRGVRPSSAEGFADGRLMKYLKRTLGWHYRIRIKCSFYFQHRGKWHRVGAMSLKPGQEGRWPEELFSRHTSAPVGRIGGFRQN